MAILNRMGVALLIVGLLNACQLSVPNLEHQIQTDLNGFSDLDREYAGFRIQVLTQGYLRSKIERWADEGEGERMRREIEYARFKHPDTLKAIMCAHPDLYDAALEMDEVEDYILESGLFADYMNELDTGCD